PTNPLPVGANPNAISVTQTNPAATVSTPVVINAPVAAPALVTPAAPMISGPACGSTLSSNTPTFSGTAQPNATITISMTPTGHTHIITADAMGQWTYLHPVLADGNYSITATQKDQSGNISPATAPCAFTIKTPVAPVTVNPIPTTNTNPTPAISGTCVSGNTVTVTINGSAQTTTCANGTFSVVPTNPLPIGANTNAISVIQSNPIGTLSTPVVISGPVAVRTYPTPPAAPVVSGPACGSTLSSSTPTFSGTGLPNATITISMTPTGHTHIITADAMGQWTYLHPVLADGDYSITATQKDSSGIVSPATAPCGFTIKTSVAPVTVNPIPVTNTNPTPVISGTCVTGNTVTITINGVAQTTACTNGTFTATPTNSLPIGTNPNVISATQSNPAGTVSNPVVINAPVVNPVLDIACVATNTCDTDGDGVIDSIENAGPNNGDGNGDNIPDKFQPNVATIKNSDGKYVTIVASGECQILKMVKTYNGADMPKLDPDFSYPFGLLGFEAPCGKTVNLTYFWHDMTNPSQYKWRKYIGGSYQTWSNVTVGSQTVGSKSVVTSSFSITDNQAGDDDSTVGNIRDPFGPGLMTIKVVNTGATSVATPAPVTVTSLVGTGSRSAGSVITLMTLSILGMIGTGITRSSSKNK
ncbi:MAG: hypothetical protein H7230_03455, partial [Candidatus Parcubacteria bacterium]|nr:hypothetical protein [Candidatus Paceibacterota bacterium]